MSKTLADTIADRTMLGGWPSGHSRRIACALTEAEWWTVISVLRSWDAAVVMAEPAARVVDDNQPGRRAVVEIECDPPTLGVGTPLYVLPKGVGPDGTFPHDAREVRHG